MIARARAIVARAGVEPAGEPFEAADSHQAARLDEPSRVARRFVEDRMATGKRGLDGLRPPERYRRDVPGDGLSAPLVPGRDGMREGALLKGSRIGPGARNHPEQTECVRRVTVIARLLEQRHPELQVASNDRMLLLAPRLEAHGRKAELGSEPNERFVAASGVESSLLEERLCLGEPPCFLQCLAELQLELDPGVVGWREQGCRTSEKVDRADHVASIECTNARRAEPARRRARPARRRVGPALR